MAPSPPPSPSSSSQVLLEIQQEIKQLKDKINHHNYCYYILDQPEISDKEFDDLLKKLIQLESNFPQFITSDSPTQRVGSAREGMVAFASHRHSKPMLSLENVYFEEEFLEWWKRVQKNLGEFKTIEVVIEPKLDGTSLSLVYEDGILKSASTRGDGTTGEDVTLNVRTIRSVPLKLVSTDPAPPKRFECRGEVYILKKDFERLNLAAVKSGQKTFVNPRNAAAGSLRQKNPLITASRHLRFVVHSIGEIDPELKIETHTQFIQLCKKFHLPVALTDPIELCRSAEEVNRSYRKWEERRVSLPYEVDGIVIKVNALAQQNILAETAKTPRWAVAFKFRSHQTQTTILGIEFSVGRTGVITPVAKVKPVECGGVTISSISLHNFDEIERLALQLYDTVLIERAGDVIPKVVRVVNESERVFAESNKKSEKISPPQRCPSCSEKVFHKKELEVAIRCINSSCPAQFERKLLYFASRDGMNIEGLGKSVVRQLQQKGLVQDFADLYLLMKEDLLQCALFADKKAENLLKQIEMSKGCPLSKLLVAIGIRHVGEKVARILAEQFGSLEKLMKASLNELLEIKTLGPIIAQSIVHFFSQKSTIELIEKLKKSAVNFIEPQRSKTGSSFTGKKVVFTGELLSYSRIEAQSIVHQLGGTLVSTISRKTHFLICGKNPGSKLERAKKLGIPILFEEQFKELIAEGSRF